MTEDQFWLLIDSSRAERTPALSDQPALLQANLTRFVMPHHQKGPRLMPGNRQKDRVGWAMLFVASLIAFPIAGLGWMITGYTDSGGAASTPPIFRLMTIVLWLLPCLAIFSLWKAVTTK